MSWPLIVAAAACCSLVLAACESTQSKSARLASHATEVKLQHGLRIGKRSTVVKVERTAVLSDANGTAAVVALRNTSKRPLAGVPVAIDVRGTGKRSVFKNDDPGLDPALTGVPLLLPGQELLWVNDQVLATAKGRTVRATVGRERGRAPAHAPQLELAPPRLEADATSGLLAVGKVTNRSSIEQRNLVVYAVAHKGRDIVAAGRGAIERLKPRASATYQVFFVGNPKGARITLAAPPTTLR